MKIKDGFYIQIIIGLALAFLIISNIVGIFTYEQTRYVFYFVIIVNAVVPIYFLRLEKRRR